MLNKFSQYLFWPCSSPTVLLGIRFFFPCFLNTNHISTLSKFFPMLLEKTNICGVLTCSEIVVFSFSALRRIWIQQKKRWILFSRTCLRLTVFLQSSQTSCSTCCYHIFESTDLPIYQVVHQDLQWNSNRFHFPKQGIWYSGNLIPELTEAKMYCHCSVFKKGQVWMNSILTSENIPHPLIWFLQKEGSASGIIGGLVKKLRIQNRIL